MAYTFYANPRTAKAGIFSGTDEAVLDDPLANIGQIKADFNLNYVGSVSVFTGNLGLDTSVSPWVVSGRRWTRNIVAHGLAYAPLVIGYLTIGGIQVPINQTIIYAARHYNIGANSTHIVVHSSVAGAASGSYPTVAYTIYCLNVGRNTNGTAKMPDYYNFLEVTPTRFRCAKYDSNLRYLYKDTNGPLALIQGRSTALGVGAMNPQGYYGLGVGLKQRVNGYSVTRPANGYSGAYANKEGTTNGSVAAFSAAVVTKASI